MRIRPRPYLLLRKCPTSCQLVVASGSSLLGEPRQAGSLSDIARLAFHSFKASPREQRDMKAPPKIPGSAGIHACGLPAKADWPKQAGMNACAPRGFPFFQGVATRTP